MDDYLVGPRIIDLPLIEALGPDDFVVVDTPTVTGKASAIAFIKDVDKAVFATKEDLEAQLVEISDLLGTAVAQGNVPIFSSAVGVANLVGGIPGGMLAFETRGYYAAGDGGGATYLVMASGDPDQPGQITDVNGVRAKITNFHRDVRMYGAKCNGTWDDTAAFNAACSVPGVLTSPGGFNITDTVTRTSNLALFLRGAGTSKIEASGQKRGLWCAPGTKNSHIFGDATIELTVNTAGTDGSYNCAIGFGEFYVTGTSSAIRDCEVSGRIKITSVGVANGKPVHIYGWCEEIKIRGVDAFGLSNFMFSAHWSGNGDVGVLPDKTWHPHLITWEDCSANGDGAATLRAFTCSATGIVRTIRCRALNAPTNCLNLFVGDYGFTYAQNILPGQAMQHYIEDFDADNSALPIVVDGISSGLNGSPTWSAADKGEGDIYIAGRFRATLPTGYLGDLMGFTGVDRVTFEGMDILERSADGVGADLAKFSGVNYVEVHGKAVVGRGPLFRNCGRIVWAADMTSKEGLPQAARYGISASASDVLTTTIGAKALGSKTITVADVPATVGTGAGTIIQYDDGTKVHEIDCRTYVPPGKTNVTLVCQALPVAIPAGAAVRVITTVKGITVEECTIDGFAAAIRLTGSATAKVRNLITEDSFEGLRWGNIGIDLGAVDGFKIKGKMDKGGLAASGVKYGIAVGANAEGGRVSPEWGKNNRSVRYGVHTTAGAKDCIYDNGQYLSIDPTASGAATFIPATGTTNVVLGTGNQIAAGVPLS